MKSIFDTKFSYGKFIVSFNIFLLALYVYFLPTYSACIEGNCKNGHGVKIWDTGVKYVGNFKNGKRNGRGTYFSPNGNKYEGDWRFDIKTGIEELFYDNRKTINIKLDQTATEKLWRTIKSSSNKI